MNKIQQDSDDIISIQLYEGAHQRSQQDNIFGDIFFQEEKPIFDNYSMRQKIVQSEIYNQFYYNVFQPKEQVVPFFTELKPLDMFTQKQQMQAKNNIEQEQKKNKPKSQFLKRNRQSSRLCRQKKKLYFQQLQKKSVENQKKINDLTKRLRENQLQLLRLKNNSNKQMQSFHGLFQLNLEKLRKILQSQNKSELLMKYLNQNKSTFGPAGKIRLDFLNYLMSEYIENLGSDLFKYFILCNYQQKGLFEKGQETQLDLEIRKVLQLDLIKKDRICKKYQKNIEKISHQFIQARQKLYKCHIDLANCAKQFQVNFHSMKKQLSTPQNFFKLIIFFQENAHRPDIRQLKYEWFSIFNNENDLIQNHHQLKKKTKLFDNNNNKDEQR